MPTPAPQHRPYLAPPRATGRYLGVFGLGAGLSEAVGPGPLIALCIGWGRPGWYVVGALFALTGLLTPWAVRRAEAAGRYEKRETRPYTQMPTMTTAPAVAPVHAITPSSVHPPGSGAFASSGSPT